MRRLMHRLGIGILLIVSQFQPIPSHAQVIGNNNVQFIQNGTSKQVKRDTSNPSNNIPLPVIPMDASGNIGQTNNQGSPNSLANAWPVKPTDGTNSQTFLSTGEGKVSVTQPLPTGTNSIGAVTQGGVWSVGRTWSLLNTLDSVNSVQSGTWTIQPGNTANTTPWLFSLSQGGNTATVSAGGALLVDGSASTQPVSGTVTATQGGTWNINNISGTVSLPSGAATAAKQPALGTAGSPSSDVITVQGITSMTALKVDGSAVTQPVSGTIAATQSGNWSTRTQDGSGNSITSTSSALDVNVKSSNLAVSSSSSSGSQANGTVSTVITLTAPANALGFILYAEDANTDSLRYAVGATATTTLGLALQAGRDSGFVPCSANVSLVAVSGTQSYQIQWFIK